MCFLIFWKLSTLCYPSTKIAKIGLFLVAKVTACFRNVLLNGQILMVGPDGSLPSIKPKIVAAHPYVIMPPYSLAFWVVPTDIKYCL